MWARGEHDGVGSAPGIGRALNKRDEWGARDALFSKRVVSVLIKLQPGEVPRVSPGREQLVHPLFIGLSGVVQSRKNPFQRVRVIGRRTLRKPLREGVAFWKKRVRYRGEISFGGNAGRFHRIAVLIP